MRLLRGCPECGATWREPTARFCGVCGARLEERTDPTARSVPRLSFRLPSRPARVATGIAIAGLVAAALGWAASRPPGIQQIDVAVPGPTELQAPPDREAELPRCVIDRLEQDCVTWQLDARITGAAKQGKLLVILRHDGAVQGINPTTGDIVWSTNTPVIDGGLVPTDLPGRIVVVGNGRLLLVDAGTGRMLGKYSGWLHRFDGDTLAVVDENETGWDTLFVDLVSGQAEERAFSGSEDEYVIDVGDPTVTLAYESIGPPGSEQLTVRSYRTNGDLAWAMSGVRAPLGTRPLVYLAVEADDPSTYDVRALEPRTGDLVWTRTFVLPEEASMFGGAGGSIVREALVVADDTDLVVLEARTGEEHWRVPTPHPDSFLTNIDRPGEIVLSVWSSLGQNQLVGLDADTGETLWTGPSLENQWWDPSLVTDDGLLTSTGREYAIHHYDGTVTSFGLTGRPSNLNARILSLDPLVVSSGYRLYGLDADVALSGEPRPRESE